VALARCEEEHKRASAALDTHMHSRSEAASAAPQRLVCLVCLVVGLLRCPPFARRAPAAC
jgi:hypothetical protein